LKVTYSKCRLNFKFILSGTTENYEKAIYPKYFSHVFKTSCNKSP